MKQSTSSNGYSDGIVYDAPLCQTIAYFEDKLICSSDGTERVGDEWITFP